MLQRKAQAKGIELDVGVIPTYTGMDPSENDPERPVRIVAHGIARLADRFPALRKVSRQVEGTDGKAGLGADIAAAGYEIFVRNQSQLEDAARRAIRAAEQKRAQRQQEGGSTRSRFSRNNTQED